MIDRIMALPFAPLLMMIALSNTALAAIILLSMYNDPARTVHIGIRP